MADQGAPAIAPAAAGAPAAVGHDAQGDQQQQFQELAQAVLDNPPQRPAAVQGELPQPGPSPNLRVQMSTDEQAKWLSEMDYELSFALCALKIPNDVQARMSQMGFQLLETWAKVEDSQA